MLASSLRYSQLVFSHTTKSSIFHGKLAVFFFKLLKFCIALYSKISLLSRKQRTSLFEIFNINS